MAKKMTKYEKLARIERVLREFWLTEAPNGAHHACGIPTDRDNAKSHPSMRVLSLEKAAEKILKVIEG